MHERRKYRRFTLDDACIIHHEQMVGTVVDLSIGGVSCVCLEQGQCEQDLVTSINIYCNRHELCAEKIGMKILGTETAPGQFHENVRIRRCRIQFQGLDDVQEAQLFKIIVKSSLPK